MQHMTKGPIRLTNLFKRLNHCLVKQDSHGFFLQELYLHRLYLLSLMSNFDIILALEVIESWSCKLAIESRKRKAMLAPTLSTQICSKLIMKSLI